MKYDADGNVKKIVEYDGDTQDGKYATSMQDAVQQLRKEDLVVMQLTQSKSKITYDKNGRTVYNFENDPNNDNGIFVSADVKIVLSQINKNKRTDEEYTGWSQLKSILDTLNEDKDNKHSYTFGAVIENGRITSVVIVDEVNDYDGQGPAGGQATDVKTVLLDENGTVTLKNKNGETIQKQEIGRASCRERV